MKTRCTRLRRIITQLPLSEKARAMIALQPNDKSLKDALCKAIHDWARVCCYTQSEVVAREDAAYKQGWIDAK